MPPGSHFPPPNRAIATEDAMRAALAAGDPVFVQRANGSVIGLEPYKSPTAATMTCLVEGMWDEVLYPANEFVRVTDSVSIMRCGLPLELDGGYAHIDDIVFGRKGTVTITDLVTGNVLHDGVTSLARGYDQFLADTWGQAFEQLRRGAENIFPSLDDGPQTVHVRTTTGQRYEFVRNAVGVLRYADLNQPARTPVHQLAASITVLQTNRIYIETSRLGELTGYISEISRVTHDGTRGPLSVDIQDRIAALTRAPRDSGIPLPGPALG